MAVTLRELANRFDCDIDGPDATCVKGVAGLAEAGPDELAFLADPHYRSQLDSTRAGVVVLDERFREGCPVPCLVTPNPHAVYARIAALLHPVESLNAGQASSAMVAPDAHVDSSAEISHHAVVGRRSHIGEAVFIGPGCVIGADVTIGPGSRLVARVSLLDGVSIGAHCIIHPGAVIGADGFGFARDEGAWVKVPQLGRVLIGDDVEIGANSTVDRGALKDTLIEEGVKIDNLVHIAHNVRIGAHTAIAGTAAVAGSARIGRRCMIGGGAGILGQLEICDDVVVLARSLVTRSILSSGVYSGSLPAEEAGQWRRNAARFRHLDEYVDRLKSLEHRRVGSEPSHKK